MPSIPELLKDHITLEVECLDRLYLNGYIGSLATSGGLVTCMREQLGKPIPSPVVLGQVTEKFREAAKALAERELDSGLPVQSPGAERRCGQPLRRTTRRARRDCIHRCGAGEGSTWNGDKVNGQFEFTRDKTVYVNHSYFYQKWLKRLPLPLRPQ